MADEYAIQYATYAQNELEFAKNPAVLVVDLERGFTDSAFKMGGAPLIERAVFNTARLSDVARTANVPIAKCVMAYSRQEERPYWKVGACHNLILGSPECEIDPRVHEPSYDMTIVKNSPSIFLQTPVITCLIRKCDDTTITTGCVTSGCVRASVIDSFHHGFRTMVPKDCVGDYDNAPRMDNLRDVGRRYADITNADEMAGRIHDWGESNSR